MDILIRPERPADYENINEITTLAFKRPNEARLIEALRQTPEYIPELSLVAEREGTIVGHILLSHMHAEENASARVLGLGPIAVHPEWQRQGIGRQLIRDALRLATELGYDAVILLGHPTYYPRFGFKPAVTYGLKCTWPVPDEVFMALPLRSDGLDGVQGIVHYSSAFNDV